MINNNEGVNLPTRTKKLKTAKRQREKQQKRFKNYWEIKLQKKIWIFGKVSLALKKGWSKRQEKDQILTVRKLKN